MKKNKKGSVSKFVVFSMSLALLVSLGVSAYGYTVSRKTDSSGTQIYLLDDSGNLTISGGLTAAGVINLGSFTETVADGAVITNEAKVAVLTGTTGGTTNTVANPSAAGEELILVNNSAFPIVFADSGNVKLSGAITLGEDDTLHLVSTSASEWVEVSTSDN